MQEKIYVRAVLFFIVILIIAVIYTWYPKLIGEKEESTSDLIPVSTNNSQLEEKLACENGQFQSPIDIKQKSIQKKEGNNLQIIYKPTLLKIYNGEKTIHAATTSKESFIKIDDEPFHLVDIHFHYPSEHTINGKYYEMEMHLVHENEKGDLVVVAALFQEGKGNELLSPILEWAPSNMEKLLQNPIDLSKIIQSNSAYHYVGSLTTPPCTEGVKWFVLNETYEISKEQLTAYKKNYPQNNRPIQQLNDREVNEIIINE